MLPVGGACALKLRWGSLSLCTGPGRWRGGENAELMEGKFGRERGGGGAVTECQSKCGRPGTDGDEEREKG